MQAAVNLNIVAPNDGDNANKDSANQFSTSNVTSLLTVGSNLGITGLNLTTTLAKLPRSMARPQASRTEEKGYVNTAFELKMEEARLYPELAGRSFEPPTKPIERRMKMVVKTRDAGSTGKVLKS